MKARIAFSVMFISALVFFASLGMNSGQAEDKASDLKFGGSVVHVYGGTSGCIAYLCGNSTYEMTFTSPDHVVFDNIPHANYCVMVCCPGAGCTKYETLSITVDSTYAVTPNQFGSCTGCKR